MRRMYGDVLGRVSAATIGAPVATVVLCLALGAFFPASGGIGLALVEVFAYPLAAIASCVALVSASGSRAWLSCVLAGALGLALLGFSRLLA